jgi:hypothetical protein
VTTRPSGTFGPKKLLWLAVFAVLLLVTGALVGARLAEERVLARASEHLAAGHLDAAMASLSPLKGRRFLSREAARRAASLYFRLGEDHTAHSFLRGQPFSETDPEDIRLRELSARCQRATSLLKQAEESPDPLESARLAREALRELPDSPRVLQWVAREEMLAMAATGDPAREKEFERAYTELRRRAPSFADALKREVDAATER